MQKRLKKNGWFIGRTYRHFDTAPTFEAAEAFVSSPQKVTVHDFRPLLSYEKIERRFQGFRENGKPRIRHKPRLLCYAAHRDAQIYAYYAHQIEKKYAVLRARLGIDDCVLAYRPGHGSNINMANRAFEAIKSYDSCSVIAMDIRRFFDNVNHANLKKQWCRVLDKDVLPADHYKIFKSLTRFSRVDAQGCLNALGKNKKDLQKSTERLCDDDMFHKRICGRQAGYADLVIMNADQDKKWHTYGIPQGTPISALMSNIFMIDFDLAMQALAKKVKGIYYRYSDDILFICPQEQEEVVHDLIRVEVENQGDQLKINDTKTEIARFKKENEETYSCQIRKTNGTWTGGQIQYLGFNFDGKRKMIRHPTIAKFQRKRKYAVRSARRAAEHFKKDKIRSKELYVDLTDLGSTSVPSYAKRAAKIMNDNTPVKQVRNNRKELGELIAAQNKVLAERRLSKKATKMKNK